jgi:hypothetical protein
MGIFVRFDQWNTRAGDLAPSSNRYQQWNVGINFWPHPNVALKFDYQNQNAPSGMDEFDGFNLGIGYQF